MFSGLNGDLEEISKTDRPIDTLYKLDPKGISLVTNVYVYVYSNIKFARTVKLRLKYISTNLIVI